METTIVTAIATPQMLYLVCNRKDLALEKKIINLGKFIYILCN